MQNWSVPLLALVSLPKEILGSNKHKKVTYDTFMIMTINSYCWLLNIGKVCLYDKNLIDNKSATLKSVG